MRRNGIPFNALLQLREQFCTEKGLDKKKIRGRPPLYPLSLILAISSGKQRLNLAKMRCKRKKS